MTEEKISAKKKKNQRVPIHEYKQDLDWPFLFLVSIEKFFVVFLAGLNVSQLYKAKVKSKAKNCGIRETKTTCKRKKIQRQQGGVCLFKEGKKKKKHSLQLI